MSDKKLQKTIHITDTIDGYIKKHMKEQKITNYSVAVCDALEYAFDPAFRGEREAELSKKIDRLSYSINEHRKLTGRDFVITQEMLLNVLFNLFKRIAPVPDNVENIRDTQATAELQKIMKDIIQNMPNTKPMSERQ